MKVEKFKEVSWIKQVFQCVMEKKKRNLERYFVNIINSSSGSALQFERRRRKGGVGRMMWRSLREMKTNQRMQFKL